MTAPAICHCGHPFEAHRDGATHCTTCTTCPGYAERAEVAAIRDQLDQDDALNGERRRDNLATAIHLARKRGVNA